MCAYGEDDVFSKNWSELKQLFENENIRYIKYNIMYNNIIVSHNNYRRRIGDTAGHIMLKYISEQQIEWMYGLPLYNFLMENSEPFDSINSLSVGTLMDNWKKLGQKFPLVNIRGKLAGNRQLT